jgi:hypothetical protein
MEWQPIESAPRDGTHILGYADGEMTTVYWEPGSVGIHPHWCLVVVVCWVEGDEFWPTHWMPLPKPPQTEE